MYFYGGHRETTVSDEIVSLHDTVNLASSSREKQLNTADTAPIQNPQSDSKEVHGAGASNVVSNNCDSSICTVSLDVGYQFSYPVLFEYTGYHDISETDRFTARLGEESNENYTQQIVLEIHESSFEPAIFLQAGTESRQLVSLVEVNGRTWGNRIRGELGCVASEYFTALDELTVKIGFNSCNTNPLTGEVLGKHLYEDEDLVSQTLRSFQKVR